MVTKQGFSAVGLWYSKASLYGVLRSLEKFETVSVSQNTFKTLVSHTVFTMRWQKTSHRWHVLANLNYLKSSGKSSKS